MSKEDIPEVNVNFDDWVKDDESKANDANSLLTEDELDFSDIDRVVASIGKSPRDAQKSPRSDIGVISPRDGAGDRPGGIVLVLHCRRWNRFPQVHWHLSES